MALLGIDIGSSNCVMATISKGTVQVIRNELSERITPSLLSFTQDRRLIGDHAQAQIVSNCNNTCRNIKNYLGMFYDSIAQESSGQYSLCPLQKAEYGLTGYEVQYKEDTETFSATRIMATLLRYLVKVARNFIGSDPTQLVISCPGWFTDIQRSALLSAVEIANLKCLRIISEHTATALDYGIYRMSHFSTTTPVYVAFVAMGHCNTSISVVEFTKERFKILSEVSERKLGGKDMDELIVKHICQSFSKKTGLNPLKSVKHKLKLEEQVSKIKKILSANIEAPCYLECFMEDYDINEMITRDLFVQLCSQQITPKFKTLMEEAVSTSGLSIEQITSVEMVGGCTRIPWVINCISNFFGHEPSRTLSADECVARGCALQAAMLSVHYKVIDYGCHEILNHPISLSWCSIDHIPEQFSSNPLEAFPLASFQHTSLMQKGMGTNKKQKVRIDSKGPLLVRAYYTDIESLPTGTPNYLGMCLVTPPYGPLPITIEIAINLNGQFKFMSAYTMKKAEQHDSETTTQKSSESATSDQQTSPEQSENSEFKEQSTAQNSEEEPNGTPEKEKTKQETPPPKYVKELLPMEVKTYLGNYTQEQIKLFKTFEIEMTKDDEACELRSAKLNELEASIFNLRNGLRAELQQFSTANEKDEIDQTLMRIEDWIYDNYNADINIINDVFEELKNCGKTVYKRAELFKKVQDGVNQLLMISEMCENGAIDTSNTSSSQLVAEREKLRQATSQTNQLVNLAMSLDPINPDESVLMQLKAHYDYTNELYKNFTQKMKSEESTENTPDKPMPEEDASNNSSKTGSEKAYSDSN